MQNNDAIKNEANSLVAGQLRKFRLQKGLSQQQVADVLYISNQQYSKFELGKNRISASQILILANEYSLNVSHFFHTTGFKG